MRAEWVENETVAGWTIFCRPSADRDSVGYGRWNETITSSRSGAAVMPAEATLTGRR